LGIRREDLLGKEAVAALMPKPEPTVPAEPTPQPRRRNPSVEVIRGTQKANAEF
jgi:hypothetical protein